LEKSRAEKYLTNCLKNKMPLNQSSIFPPSREVLTNYNYIELADGLGYTTFYLLATKDNTATDYVLVSNSLTYSGDTVRESQQTGAATLTRTFLTSEFNKPRTVKGTAYASLGAYWNLGVDTETFSIRLYKYDGTTTTPISSEFELDVTGSGSTVISFSLPCTQTIIKKGEQLKIVIEMEIGGGGTTMAFGHDPKNLDGAFILPSSSVTPTITSSRINIPFKIEV
jgi:hypothetical protein